MLPKNFTKIFSSITIGSTFGLLITSVLVFLDIQELDMSFTYNNVYDVINSQRIYTFSLIAFPVGFSAIIFLFNNIITNSKKINDQAEYIKNILSSMEDFLFVVDKNYSIEKQNHLEDNSADDLINTITSHSQYIDLVSGIRDHIELEFDSKTYVANYSKSTVITSYLGILSVKDITSLKEKQLQLDQKSKELELGSRLSALGEIAAGIAHEINNPLAIIQGNISLILAKFKRYGKIEEAQLELCDDKISTNIERIANIIRNLRNLASKDSSVNHASIHDLIEKSKPLVNNITNNHGIDYSVIFNTSEATLVNFNPVEFTQVLFNLFSNSKDAMSDFKNKRWIKLSVEEEDDFILFKIVDSGSGIKKEIADKIFTPLFTTKDFGKGSGIGLSLSGMLAKKNKASIFYEQNSTNTTFVIKATKAISIEKSDKSEEAKAA